MCTNTRSFMIVNIIYPFNKHGVPLTNHFNGHDFIMHTHNRKTFENNKTTLHKCIYVPATLSVSMTIGTDETVKTCNLCAGNF